MTVLRPAPLNEPSPPGMSRREWLAKVPAFALFPAFADVGAATLPWRGPPRRAPIGVAGLHSATLAVSDVGRSLEFYQALFGCSIQARQDSTVILRIGGGPRFLALSEAGGGPPRIERIGIAVPDFDPEQVVEALVDHGLEWVSGDDAGRPGPMQVVMTIRGDTTEVLLGDPHGLLVQLQDPRYCGGSGPLGDVCRVVEPAPTSGSLSLVGLSHFTNNAADPTAANEFYQSTFETDIQTYQATAPLMGVGPGDDFLMFIGGDVGRTPEEAARQPGRVHHACFTVADFTVEGVQAALEQHGIRPREGGDTGPLLHWVSMRMPNRGGAPEGTPELYFSDPDGLSIQLQDAAYCGGGGYLGEVCE